MKDMIYRDDAINAIYKKWEDVSYDGDGYHIASECEMVLDEVPSANPEVIYCEHCKHSYLFRPWDALDGEGESRFCQKFRQSFASDYDMPVEDDDYCSFAERK